MTLLLPLTLAVRLALAFRAVPPGSAQSGDVLVRFTADNAYGFGYGTETEMASYFGGLESRLANEIFSCNPACSLAATRNL